MNGWLGVIALGVILPLAINELGDVSQWLARRILSWGANRLVDPEMVERYAEEWQADLERVPGRLTKLGYALGVATWGVPRLRLQIRRRLKHQQKAAVHKFIPHVDDPSSTQSWEALSARERHALCLAAAKTGDKSAFDRLIADLSPLTWHVARSNGLSRGLSESVVQDVWLKLLRNLGEVNEPESLVGWLITTTRRFSRQRAPHELQLDNQDDSTSDKSRHVLVSDRDEALWRAFNKLSLPFQELLRLKVLASREGYEAVGTELGLDTEQVVAARNVALTELRLLFSKEAEQRCLSDRPAVNKKPTVED